MTLDLKVIGLVVLSLALFISLCINIIICIRRSKQLCRDTDVCCLIHICTAKSPSQDEGHYFHNINDDEQQENPLNHHEQQENPIYGNISSDRSDFVEICYESMEHSREQMKKSLQPDLNYASLDLKMAKKRMKKNRHQQGQAQGRNKLQDELPVHLTPPLNAFLEVEADMDAHLPSRDTSTMVSHSSIYLNSQQIAQEAEETERERGINMEWEDGGWEGIRRKDDGRSTKWKREQRSEERKDRQDNNGSVCTQLTEVGAIQSGMDCFTRSFSHDSEPQD
ncbi:uncharacterized protein LOC129113848 isoform X2 [Anoplopoma fimbria]|uniref:uncharacterized protein LOC129113848 isoform X2 n=1 Tax=Anoplopoma fimbria TaxID=229290 RepID=UPI0023ECEF0B|nr:uncharacterized protein LOC129113848 isoform X2 [Anoplopoma fimbria]